MYSVHISAKAKKQLSKIEVTARHKIARKIDALIANPRPKDVKKLSSLDDFYRIREGDYRIIYTIQDQLLIVLVIKIGHRLDIYR
jgi:mRNA interferase RelE/StbE